MLITGAHGAHLSEHGTRATSQQGSLAQAQVIQSAAKASALVACVLQLHAGGLITSCPVRHKCASRTMACPTAEGQQSRLSSSDCCSACCNLSGPRHRKRGTHLIDHQGSLGVLHPHTPGQLQAGRRSSLAVHSMAKLQALCTHGHKCMHATGPVLAHCSRPGPDGSGGRHQAAHLHGGDPVQPEHPGVDAVLGDDKASAQQGPQHGHQAHRIGDGQVAAQCSHHPAMYIDCIMHKSRDELKSAPSPHCCKLAWWSSSMPQSRLRAHGTVTASI